MLLSVYAPVQANSDSGDFISKFGTFGSVNDPFKEVHGITTDSNDRIIVTDSVNHRIQIFDDQGNLIKKFGSEGDGEGEFTNPTDVATDSNDRIIVVNSENAFSRIQIFDDQGNFIQEFGSETCQHVTCLDDPLGDDQFGEPQGITTDSNNRIIVADTLNSRIQIFDDQGTLLHRLAHQNLEILI